MFYVFFDASKYIAGTNHWIVDYITVKHWDFSCIVGALWALPLNRFKNHSIVKKGWCNYNSHIIINIPLIAFIIHWSIIHYWTIVSIYLSITESLLFLQWFSAWSLYILLFFNFHQYIARNFKVKFWKLDPAENWDVSNAVGLRSVLKTNSHSSYMQICY